MKTSANKITPRMFYDHAIRREYMSGVSREKSRVKATGEVFTPDGLVVEILERLHRMDKELFTDPKKTFIDPSAGDGQFLAHAMLMKIVGGDMTKLKDKKFMRTNIADEYWMHLKTIYGIDLMPDNVKLIRARLGMGEPRFDSILKNNIRCENALTYDFSFTPEEQ